MMLGEGLWDMCVKLSPSPSIDLQYRPHHDGVFVERKWRPTTPGPKNIEYNDIIDDRIWCSKSDMIIILEHCKVRQGLKLVCKCKQFGRISHINTSYLAISLSTAPRPPDQTEILIHGRRRCIRWNTLQCIASRSKLLSVCLTKMLVWTSCAS